MLLVQIAAIALPIVLVIGLLIYGHKEDAYSVHHTESARSQ